MSKASDEMDVDDSNELEINESDDDYTEQEEKQLKSNLNDRLEANVDNESDSDKSKMFVPYWDAYDTVNQLFLEMGELFLYFLIICIML